MNQIWRDIPFLKNIETVQELKKGFSHDKKYALNSQYLLRIFPKETTDIRKEEFDRIKKLSQLSDYVPKALDFGVLDSHNMSYMILTYLPGIDGEDGLKYLSNKEQYIAGFRAGQELKKLHQLLAPHDYPSWYSVKKKKSDHYLAE